MDKIEITKNNIKEIKYDDIMFLSFAEPGAMGEPGGIEILLKNLKFYHTNYCYDMDIKDIFCIFPPLQTFRCGLGYVEQLDKKWKWLDMGFGNYLLIRKELFKQYSICLKSITKKGEFLSGEIYQKWLEVALDMLKEESEKGKIIFYKSNGNVKSEKILTKENLMHISGMMTKCYLKNGKKEVGFAEPEGIHDEEKYDGNIHDYIYLWTWDNLDEETGELLGKDDKKYNQTFKKVAIDEIERVEAIIYSNPRWGGKLTNKFEFYKNEEKVKDFDIPKFLIKKSETEESNDTEECEEELYYFLTVKYEDYFGDKEYNYISEDTTITIGDRVLVDRAGNLVIAEVVETAYCNKFDAPFPVDKTKRIIKKVDNDFETDDTYGHDVETIKMNIDGTYFEFGIGDYWSDMDDEAWVDAKIKVYNSYFRYERYLELLTLDEVENLLNKFQELLDGKIEERLEINFHEPDLEFKLYPKMNLWNTGRCVYIKKGSEIQDIYMELNINLTDSTGAYTGQKYVMIFEREEIEKIVEYIKSIISL